MEFYVSIAGNPDGICSDKDIFQGQTLMELCVQGHGAIKFGNPIVLRGL